MALVDAGGFSVEYEDLQKLISILQDHLGRLQQVATKIGDKLVTPPPGNDAQSIRWANQAQPAVRSYLAWNQARQQDFRDKIDSLNEALKNYKQTDEDNTMRS
ncbi:MAG TPA: hypothetical protein VF444_08660 [Pseudonocardiaceae bacterium]